MTDTFIPLKHLVGINERSLPETTDPDYRFHYIDIGTVGRGELISKPEEVRFGDAPSRARRLVRAGDTIVSTVRTYLRAVWPVPPEADGFVVSTGFAVLTPRAIDRRYFSWWASSDVFIEEIVARSTGVSYPAISGLELGELSVRVPSLAEQQAIADFVDAETTRIDALITKKRRIVELLEERVNSRILELVGQSELVGAGSIPAEPVRRLLRKHERWAPDGEMITAFRDGDVTTRAARGREGFTNAWTEGGRVQRVDVGDVVIHGLDGFAGAIGDAQLPGVCSPVYHVTKPIVGDSAFYARMLRLLALDGYLGNFAVSTRERAVDFRNWDLFGRIPIPVVPVPVQMEIGSQIRAIRPLGQKIRTSAALATERRRALITAAVTGEVEVPGVSV